MVLCEGKLHVKVRSGEFNENEDLYVLVHVDKYKIMRTGEKDTSTPKWNQDETRHMKGDYETLIFTLMDEDTCT